MTDSTDDDEVPNTEALFGLLWESLVDVLGSSATASLVRRAAKHAARDTPSLAELVIHRPKFEYEYVLPSAWKLDGRETFQALIHTLVPLLHHLTGPILLHRLQEIPQLARAVRLEPSPSEVE